MQSAMVGGGGAGMGTDGAGSLAEDVTKLQEESSGRLVEAAVTGIGRSVGLRVARVVDDATGGGYYNCQLQKLSESNWESNTDPFASNESAQIVVLNIPEAGKTDSHQLEADDKMFVWRQIDDGDPAKMRWIGVEINFIKRCV